VTSREYGPIEFTLEREHVAAFARALGATPEAGVPPTYAAVYALGTTATWLFADPDAKVDFAHLVHAEQEFEWERHPEVGETILATGRVTSDTARRGMRFIGFESECKDPEGVHICRSKALFIIRS
jgi:N-terminal half of MaoC dehydratase